MGNVHRAVLLHLLRHRGAIMWATPGNPKRMLASYAVSVAGLSFGYCGAIVRCADAVPSETNNGIPAASATNSFISDPMLLVMVVVGVALALVGGPSSVAR